LAHVTLSVMLWVAISVALAVLAYGFVLNYLKMVDQSVADALKDFLKTLFH